MGQRELLAWLKKNGEGSRQEIAKALDVSWSRVSRLVLKLEMGGFGIKRTMIKRDGKAIMVYALREVGDM